MSDPRSVRDIAEALVERSFGPPTLFQGSAAPGSVGELLEELRDALDREPAIRNAPGVELLVRGMLCVEPKSKVEIAADAAGEILEISVNGIAVSHAQWELLRASGYLLMGGRPPP